MADATPKSAPDTIPARHQWQRRPVLSLLVRAAVVIVPAVAGIAAGAVLRRVLPRPDGFAAAALWFATVSLVMLITIVTLERAGRRLLHWPPCSISRCSFPTEPPSATPLPGASGSHAICSASFRKRATGE